ncbi:hypothetical protein Droror1_Dr00021016 [Drosera rotundifolia]
MKGCIIQHIYIHGWSLNFHTLGCILTITHFTTMFSSTLGDALRVLDVQRCVNLKTINGAWLRSLTSLRVLAIFECDKLEAQPEGGCLALSPNSVLGVLRI